MRRVRVYELRDMATMEVRDGIEAPSRRAAVAYWRARGWKIGGRLRVARARAADTPAELTRSEFEAWLARQHARFLGRGGPALTGPQGE